MKYVYLLKYNNYCNRIMKVENSVYDYLGTSNANLVATIEDMLNWNPNDGVTASIKTPVNTSFDTREPDYCICADVYGNIDSRWFVIENIRTRKGQYICNLKRDVFAEAWNDLMQATCNIDRAILNKYSPLIFNSEPITVNQLLTNEFEIKDKTGVPWIVFYGKEKPDPVTRSLSYNYDFTVSDIDAYKTANNYKYLPDDEGSIQLALRYAYPGKYGIGTIINQFKMLPYGYQGNIAVGGMDSYFAYATDEIHFTDPNDVTNLTSNFKTIFSLKGSEDAQKSLARNGQIAYDTGSTKYYRITCRYEEDVVYNELMLSAELLNAARTILTNYTDISYTTGHSVSNVSANHIRVFYKSRKLVTEYEEVTDVPTITAQVPTAGYEPSDTPYFIWTMPYGNIEISNTVSGVATTVTTDKDINLSVAMKFSASNSSGKLYDFQILPFCPLPDEFINADGSIAVVDNGDITDNSTLTKTVGGNTSVVGFIFSVPKASFTRQIIYESSDWQFASNKMSSICEVWRLYSPNYASSFEFSVAKNGGLSGFNIRCTYMPINPYIRIAPIWGGLYGYAEFDRDPRGLVCGGDYSMARIADAWVNYQEQNKNFESIFNREIENMDVMRKYQLIEQIASASAGVAGGAAAGAAAGSFIPGLGTAVGAVAGGITAAGTGAADLYIGQKRFEESRSYATDMHQLQLGNVQAMPRTLARTTAFNVDNRFFPILARYLPTNDEITVVNNFINNRSMNVGVIDKPINYINNRYSFDDYTEPSDRGFISGSIIKIETTFDTHFVDELNKEFQMGVYTR